MATLILSRIVGFPVKLALMTVLASIYSFNIVGQVLFSKNSIFKYLQRGIKIFYIS